MSDIQTSVRRKRYIEKTEHTLHDMYVYCDGNYTTERQNKFGEITGFDETVVVWMRRALTQD